MTEIHIGFMLDWGKKLSSAKGQLDIHNIIILQPYNTGRQTASTP